MSASVVAVEGVCLTIEVTVGAKVSPVIVSVLLAMLLSEVAFVNVFAATDIVEDRLWVFVVGVNIDVNTFKSPVAVMEDREPPLIVMSLSVKFVGTSLKVRVDLRSLLILLWLCRLLWLGLGYYLLLRS